MRDVIILGSGPASINCARSLLKINRDFNIRVITKDSFLLSKMVLPSVVRYNLREDDIKINFCENGVNFEFGTEVIDIDFERKKVYTGGGEWHYDLLFIGVGSVPLRIPFQNDRVFYPSSFAEMRKLRELIDSGHRRIVIYGFGMATIEFLDILRILQINPVVVATSSYPLSRVLPEDLGKLFFDYISGFGEFYFKEEIVNVDSSKIILRSGREVEYDALLVLKGTRPVKVGNLELEVDEYFRTRYDGVFAAGDAVRVRDMVTEEKKHIHLNSVAWETGFYAGLNMAGVQSEYRGSFFKTVSKGKALRIQVAGDLFHYDDIVLNRGRDGFCAITTLNHVVTGFFSYNMEVNFKKVCKIIESKAKIDLAHPFGLFA
ncbi:MAG: FAD-dependent oxidoreductase [Candidatus Hydrothermia bacterium]